MLRRPETAWMTGSSAKITSSQTKPPDSAGT